MAVGDGVDTAEGICVEVVDTIRRCRFFCFGAVDDVRLGGDYLATCVDVVFDFDGFLPETIGGSDFFEAFTDVEGFFGATV